MSTGQVFRPLSKKKYDGKSTGFVIGIDVGTTFSGVSYAVLRPGEIPEVQTVTKFSNQTISNSKVPSILYYDGTEMKAAGAEALGEEVVHNAEEAGWLKVEYFKMHLRPANIPLETNGLILQPASFPTSDGLTIVQVLSDFLRYLYKETLDYIGRFHADGNELRPIAEENTTFVLSHPNGWIGLPQQRMREAAMRGGLVKNAEESQSRINFVSEGEASALACLANGLCPSNLQPDFRFIIADAGGGTLDITSYEVTKTKPKLELKETTASDSRFAGSIFVNMKFQKWLEDKLRGSKWSSPKEIEDFIKGTFESLTKKGFKSSSESSWLRIANRRDSDAKLGLKMGSLRIEGSVIASCFEFSITEAIESIKHQITACNKGPMPVWLVGGFGDSPWLLQQLQDRLKGEHITVSKPDTNVAKAVANGNVLFALESCTVISRCTRSTYGTLCSVAYNPGNPEHLRRKDTAYTSLDGIRRLPQMFDVIVPKNTEVKESKTFTCSYNYLRPQIRGREFEITETVYFYCGELYKTLWLDENRSSLYQACNIIADLSELCCDSTLERRNEVAYWKVIFEIEIFFGKTELQARIKWNTNGKTEYGPASMIFDEESDHLMKD